MKRKLAELISDKFSGEWGTEGTLENGVKVIRTANFRNDGLINFNNVVYREINKKKIEAKKLKKGDIIIEKSGGSPTQPVGRVVYFDLDTEDVFLCNNFTSVLRPNRNVVHPKYLFYRLYKAHKEGRTLRYQNKTTGIINLKLEDYLNDTLEIPENIEDQLSIVTVLDKAESLIKTRNESISLLDEFLKSTFLEMFGDPGTNLSKWKVDKLASCFSSKPLIGSMIPAINAGEIPIVRVGELGDREINISKCKFSNLGKEDFEKYRLEDGDILIARAIGSESHLGKASIFIDRGQPVVYDSHVMRIRLDKSKMLPDYFYSFLQTSGGRKRFMQKAGQTAVQFNINSKQISDIDIPIPPIRTQIEFAHIVEKTSKLKVHYNASLTELENLYGSLTQKAFAGDLNISHVEGDAKFAKLSEESVEKAHSGIEQFNLWLRDYYMNLPETTAPREIDIKIKQLDTELKIRQEIPFWNEYVKHRIVKQHFKKAFDFDYLVTELSKFPFEQLPEYDTLKEMVFEWLRGEKPFLKQIFNEESNKMLLVVNEAASS